MNPATRRAKEWYWKSKANRRKLANSLKRLRENRAKLGFCYRCGKDNPDKSYRNCPNCREDCRKRQEERRNQRALNGDCMTCGEPLDTVNSPRCQKCLNNNAEWWRLRRARNANSRSNESVRTN